MRFRLLPFTFLLFWSSFFLTKAQAQTITAGPVTGTITTCVGLPSASPNIQQFTVVGTGLVDAVTVYSYGRFQVSDDPNTGYTNILTLLRTGSTLSKTVYVRITAQPAGTITDQLTLTSYLASSQAVSVTATITPLPTVNTVPNQIVASGAITAPVNLTGTGQVYNWTNDNPAIGLAASGSGDIPAFTAINNTGTTQSAVITVTPKPAGIFYIVSLSGALSFVNSSTNAVEKTINLTGGPYFTKTILSPDGKFVYVQNLGQSIPVVDAKEGTLVGEINLPPSRYAGITELSPDGSKIFTVDGNGILVFSTVTRNLVASISHNTGGSPALFSSDGQKMYVSSPSGNNVLVINTSTNAVEANINGLNAAGAMSITPDGKTLYVLNIYGQQVYAINTATNTKVTNIPTPAQPYNLTLSLDGRRLYVTTPASNSVTVVDVVSNTVIATIPVGTGPREIIAGKDGRYIYVANQGSATVSVIDQSSNTVISSITISNPATYLMLNPDGSRLYVSDDNSGLVTVINTRTNTLLTAINAGARPKIGKYSFKDSQGCDGTPTTFTITVAPPPPTITAVGSISGLTTTYGTPSVAGSFLLSGTGLQGSVTVTPPAGFEISLDNQIFSAILTVNNATPSNARVYVRLAGTANAATYTGNIVLSSPGAANVNVTINNSVVNPIPFIITGSWVKTYGDLLAPTETKYYNTPGFNFDSSQLKNGNTFNSMDLTFIAGTAATDAAGMYRGGLIISNFTGRNGYLASNYVITYNPIDLIIVSAPLTISANNITKPYGQTLANATGSTGYTITGLKNNETVGQVNLSYGAGSAGTAAPGVYAGTVVASAATGGTFMPSNYIITYINGNIEVISPPPPVFTITGAPQAVNTVYGTASASSSFTLSAINLATPITITAPDGFDLSVDGGTFSKLVTFGAAGTLAPVVINIRLSALTNAGSYTGNISVTAAPTTNMLTMPLSTVTAAPLTILANNENKVYGDVLTDGPGPIKFTIIAGSLKNGNTLSTATYIYAQGKAATANTGNYSNAISITTLTGDNGFLVTNYQITRVEGSINVLPANIDITPNNTTKVYGTLLQANQTFTAIGLKNNQTVTSVTYNYADGTLATSNVGSYAITATNAVGTFAAGNYNINYIPGSLAVTPAPLTIIAANATRKFGTANPTFTATYTGFVNNENESQLRTLPVFSTTATLNSPGGEYPVIPSGAAAANYAIGYVNGSLTVMPPTQLVIPNAFTPNNDGVNDTWKIPALTSYPNCRVQVFNRNGIQVYTSVGYVTDWDGTINGKGLPTGVYYYIIDTKVFGLKATGAITLVR